MLPVYCEGIGSNVIVKLERDELVLVETLERICETLQFDIVDIKEFISGKESRCRRKYNE